MVRVSLAEKGISNNFKHTARVAELGCNSSLFSVKKKKSFGMLRNPSFPLCLASVKG